MLKKKQVTCQKRKLEFSNLYFTFFYGPQIRNIWPCLRLRLSSAQRGVTAHKHSCGIILAEAQGAHSKSWQEQNNPDWTQYLSPLKTYKQKHYLTSIHLRLGEMTMNKSRSGNMSSQLFFFFPIMRFCDFHVMRLD